MHKLLVFLIFISCKGKPENTKSGQLIDPSSDFQEKFENVSFQSKELVAVFYQHLMEDSFLSTKEFTSIFGHTYDEADIYLKRQSDKKNDHYEGCDEISDDCTSFIFISMKQRLHEISYGYEMDVIQNAINNGDVQGDSLILAFPNNEIVTFYFKELESVNSFNLIISNIMTQNRSFLSYYEE
ncbi:hypothetical protein [Flagellimonas marina]|uniref:DUF4252 domain-containing protein n=1 Tax=Flagellimonas marina TaxID=1775168 RepID=A0ABV8PQ85_9FLAO